MRPLSVTLTPANADADGLVDGGASSASPLALNGLLASGGVFTSADGLGRQLVILDVGADVQTTATYTIVGTDANDNALTESLAGPGSSSSVVTVNFFKTVTSITIANPVATSTVDIGTNGLVASPAYPCEFRAEAPNGYTVTLTGTCSYTIEETRTNILHDGTPGARWIASANMASKSATAAGESARAIAACRIKTASYTNGASLVFDLIRQSAC